MSKYFKYATSVHPPSPAGRHSHWLSGRQAFTLPFFLLFTFYFLLSTSCTPDPPPTLSYKDRQIVDSLFRIQVDSLKPLLDSICDMQFDSAVQHTVDSIIKERKTEKDKYLERLKKDLEGKK